MVSNIASDPNTLKDGCMNSERSFSLRSVHNLIYRNNFCDFAQGIREELLNYPRWHEMSQASYEVKRVINPQRQNGITVGHINDKHYDALPNCLKFRELLQNNLREICENVGVGFAENLEIEMNAMAYGEGSWLSGHTDSGKTETVNDRLVAWMLYLTHPEDGEWSPSKGGAVRLWNKNGEEARVYPLFNKFAAFRVHSGSFHEIEKITWRTGWDRARLALSGWIRGVSDRPKRDLTVYFKSEDYLKRREELEARLSGSRALYTLMLQQKKYCGEDCVETEKRLNEIGKEYAAHLAAPPSTSFSHHAPGLSGCITVVDEQNKVCYIGTISEYNDVVIATIA
jgi:Rps23 Pro-64 3,4-dihydroxylase Tpa1-like proline 4-hydroxylase